MFAIPLLITPMIVIDWFIWGYSLSYAAASNHFIGNLNFVVLRQFRNATTDQFTNSRGHILAAAHVLFNMFFKIICAALTFPGCVAERGRILPMILFVFIWSTIIYNPVTYWFWNKNGWLSVDLGRLPVLDFAGGNCVHIVSGFTCLAYSYILGPRNPKLLYNYRNVNTGHIIFGTFCVVYGWMGFIAGCDFKFSFNSLYIILNTLIAASTSAIVWTAIDYLFSSVPLEDIIMQPVISRTGVAINQRQHESKSNFVEKRKFSMISFSSGLMAGLVVFTPAGGYVSSNADFWKGIVFGVIGAIGGNLATRLKYFFNIDDALDIFAIHGVPGIIGSLLTGIFANKLYGSKGGWVEGHWKQFGYQLLGVVVTSAYVFFMSMVFLYLIDLIPGMHLRIDKDFNRREREKKMMKKSAAKPDEELESQVSPHRFETDTAVSEQPSFWEEVELQGTDAYEFNGEYMLDFMEFIRVIRPQDYLEDEEVPEILQSSPNGFHGHDFELHQDEANHLTKRE
ncbi:amt1 Ammonium transporter 1 [Candida maltosa Xu316]